MSFEEKGAEKHEFDASVSSGDAMKGSNYYVANEALVEPEERESLHRDLSARQISMIAVRLVLHCT